jgi:DinB family protein
MKTIFNPRDHLELHERVQRLTTTQKPRWGKMTPLQMVAHLTDSLRMASGELEVVPKKVPIRFSPLKQLVLYLLPIPKGLPSSPELTRRRPGDWSTEIARLREELNGLVERGAEALAPSHPAFGKLSAKQWGVLIYRHMDHHLKQFGV